MLKRIEAKITEIKEGKMLLEIEHQKIVLNSDYFSKNVLQGSKLKLYFLDSATAITAEKKLAKMILEEILNGK